MFSDPNLAARFAACPPALQTIVEEFQDASPPERLDYMVDYSESLPDLPAWLHDQRHRMEQVHECQTPVFLHAALEDGGVHFYFDIPPESPTVRGYASILATGLNGAAPEQVLATPDEVYNLLGLQEVVSHLRLRGLHALMGYMKRKTLTLLG